MLKSLGGHSIFFHICKSYEGYEQAPLFPAFCPCSPAAVTMWTCWHRVQTAAVGRLSLPTQLWLFRETCVKRWWGEKYCSCSRHLCYVRVWLCWHLSYLAAQNRPSNRGKGFHAVWWWWSLCSTLRPQQECHVSQVLCQTRDSPGFCWVLLDEGLSSCFSTCSQWCSGLLQLQRSPWHTAQSSALLSLHLLCLILD